MGNIDFGLIIAALVVISLGFIHVMYPKRIARFYTDNYRGRQLIEELVPNQRIRPRFVKILVFIIIAIGVWLGLSGLKVL